MKRITVYSLLLITMAIFTSNCGTNRCKQKQNDTTSMNESNNIVGKMPIGYGGVQPKQLAPIVIYKTNGNYKQMVPVLLGTDGSIISYPSRFDLGTPGNFAYPIELDNGYLWDRRGVGPNSAFLSLSYEEYAALPEDPSSTDLVNYIMDKKPFSFLAVCDRSQLTEVTPAALNKYIADGFPGARILINE